MRNLSRGIDIFMPRELNKVKWSIYFPFFSCFVFVLKPFSLKFIEKFRPKEAEFSPNFGKFLRCLEGPLSHLL